MGTDSAALQRVIFDRGHGSAWGNQFSTELTPSEIVITRFFCPSDPSRTLVTRVNLAIASEEWQQIAVAATAVLPQISPEKHGLQLFPFSRRLQKLDGSAYRKLTLFFLRRRKLRSISAELPDSPEARTLEHLLERLTLTHSAASETDLTADPHTNN
ncbi:MAG: hypothetical protein IKU55_00205 [Clostridia bacterium]|nr:hypothetical protein [Clostridia bacterium]